MKNKMKMILHLLVSVCVSFVLIYLFVFCGGWKLLGSGDPIMMEIAAALVLGVVFWIFFEITKSYETKIKALEQRIEVLERKPE